MDMLEPTTGCGGGAARGDTGPFTPRLGGAYRPRAIRFLGHWAHGGWRLKVYGIAARGERPRDEFVAAARAALPAALPRDVAPDGPFGLGFAILHDGEEACWALLDWWSSPDIVCQRLFSAPLATPGRLGEVGGDLLACVWELAVIAHERQAWLDAVLARPGGPSIEAYLSATFEATL